MSAALSPISARERIATVDVARGFALLGILLMNVIGFAFPFTAYFNPTVAGGITGWNLAAWCIQIIAFDGKMRALFSMLFGAGVLILTARGEYRGAGIATADIYYRRTLWLLLFGIAHAYLLWWGDILYPYALCGLVLFPLRVLRPSTLLIVAAVLFLVMAVMSVGQGLSLRELRDKALAARAAEAKRATLTAEQKKDKEDWEKALKGMQPPPEEIKKETDAFRGGYLATLRQRAGIIASWHGKPFYSPLFFDFYSMMLLGMAFLKLDILTGARSRAFYIRMAVFGFLIGLPLNSVSAWQAVASNFEITTMPIAFCTYQFGRLAVAAGYLAVLILIVKAGVLTLLPLAAVGQMALSNYVAQSVLCNFIFYGFGLGLFGRLDRHQLYPVVLAVWAFHLIWSPLWLRHFHFGPLEWCWRSLTYWKRQPMRIRPAPEPDATAPPGALHPGAPVAGHEPDPEAASDAGPRPPVLS
jgi:uncharacterized protein